jgi:hypothetical protein
MRLLAICVTALSIMLGACIAPAWAGEAAGREQAPSGMTCYMPYSVNRDHLVTGCEIPGYRMDYDAARAWGMFMVLLPDGVDAPEHAPYYFGVDTLAFAGRSLQGLLDADFKSLQGKRPGTRAVKRLRHTLPIKGSGRCVGLSVVYPKKVAYFPYETYYLCEGGSKRYALMLTLSAASQRQMRAAMPAFLRWMDVPQTVRDAGMSETPRASEGERPSPGR